ncbi:MAG: outer membrane PBP1 activator LpoA protein [Paraglaciecola sp.]|jgi:outer membrane PBP1 activator LpoA protein
MNLSRAILITSVILFSVSCSTDVSKKTRTPITIIEGDVERDSQYYLEQAKQMHDKSDSMQRNAFLLQAAQSLQTQNQCQQSIKLLHVIEPELYDLSQQSWGQLLLAECYMQLPSPALFQAQALVANIAQTTGFEYRIHALKAKFDLHNKHWLSAAKNVFASAELNKLTSEFIWEILKNLDSKQLEQARLREPQLQAWIQLAIITQRYGLHPEKLKSALAQWQSRYPEHPLNLFPPEEVLAAITLPIINPAKVAVLLPLTGRLGTQGSAIKNGILAAYLQSFSAVTDAEDVSGNMKGKSAVRQIHFFDSALKTPAQLNALVADYDFIIGPLLKENIAELMELLPRDKPLLALNRIEVAPQNGLAEVPLPKRFPQPNSTVKSTERPKELTRIPTHETYFFALAPEDEASQLAKNIRAKGYKHPIVLAADTSTTQRMSEAFLQQWASEEELEDYPAVDHATFTDSKNMRQQVSELLDVSQSKTRVKQIESLTTTEVYKVERNRRDVDAIVLFANPEQTELLNPIIESSLSPFTGGAISVFASSRSHSLDLTKNSIRDLRNLTFIDMPWMLPAHPWQSLAEQTTHLWPQPQDTLLRLFAMGYDAYSLLPLLRHLHVLPHNSISGLTGTLSINTRGEVQRVLPWAKVTLDRVTLIAMD